MIAVIVVLVATAAFIALGLRSGFRATPDDPRRRDDRPPGPPRKASAAVEDGEVVEIAGTVVAITTMAAPASKRHCVYWTLDARLISLSQVAMSSRSSGEAFLVDDGTRRALVDPTGAQVDIPTPEYDGPVEDVIRLLHPGEPPSAGELRVFEGRIEHGQTVVVSGLAKLEQDPDPAGAGPGYRDGPTMRVRFTYDRHHELRIRVEPG